MRKRLLVAAVLAATFAGVVAPTTQAATRPTTYWLYLGSSCAGGRSSDRAEVRLVWRNANGVVKQDVTFRASNAGHWPEVCLPYPKVLRTGDLLKAFVGGIPRKLRIPLLKINLDAASDTFYGRAPANSTIRLGHDGIVGEVPVTVGSDGRWSYHDPATDIQGGSHAYARWRSAKGDTVTFENVAP